MRITHRRANRRWYRRRKISTVSDRRQDLVDQLRRNCPSSRASVRAVRALFKPL
jgi:hypothetical protein